jgi:PRTRC genetic system protein E
MFVKIERLLQIFSRRIPFFGQFRTKIMKFTTDPSHTKADENPALSTPVTYTGSPAELDAELGKHMADYVQVHQQTGSTLAEAKATLEAAAKAAQEEAKRKAEEGKKAAQKPPATTAPGSASSASPTPAEPMPASASTGTLGLFPATSHEPASIQSKGGLAL